MALIDSLLVFTVSLIIGSLGIYTGARLVTGEEDFSNAVVAALIGAVVWGVVSFFVGGVAVLGPWLALISWAWVINMRYEGGWLNAIFISLFSWLAAAAILAILSWLGITTFTAIGVPPL